MTGVRRRGMRAATGVAVLVCAAGLTACGGGGDVHSSGVGIPPASAAATASATASAAATATKEAAPSDAEPCALLTPALVAEVLQQTPPAPDGESPTMCSYTVAGGNGLGDTVSLAVEKWQDGRTVQDELADLGIEGPHGQDTPQPLPDEGLGADAVDVWDDSSVAVIWKDGDVHKLVVTGSTRVPDTKALLIDAAKQIHARNRG